MSPPAALSLFRKFLVCLRDPRALSPNPRPQMNAAEGSPSDPPEDVAELVRKMIGWAAGKRQLL